MSNDPFDLQRFVTAQAPIYANVLTELRDAYKRSHWMWFVFPQLRGLGLSSMAQFYGITSLDEAKAYLAHPVLGPRLVECTKIVLEAKASSLNAIFGSPDDVKFGSSMTLFDLAAPESLFGQAIEQWCDGKRDGRTIAMTATSA